MCCVRDDRSRYTHGLVLFDGKNVSPAYPKCATYVQKARKQYFLYLSFYFNRFGARLMGAKVRNNYC